MASDSNFEVRVGAPGNVLEVRVGTVEVDVPRPVRAIGEILEGAAKPVGSDAEGVIQLEDQQKTRTKVVKAGRSTRAKRSASAR